MCVPTCICMYTYSCNINHTCSANDGYVDYAPSWDLVHKGNIFREFALTQGEPIYRHFSTLRHTYPTRLSFARLFLANKNNQESLHEHSTPDP